MNIEDIKDPSFLKQLNNSELQELSDDIRQFLMKSVSKTGGHFSSTLMHQRIRSSLMSVISLMSIRS